MKLVNPGAGEITDRLTILALKILAGSERGSDTTHFEQERASLQQKIHARTLNGLWFDSVLELAAVNAMLWQSEDLLREVRAKHNLTAGKLHQLDLDAAVILAFRIQSLNDRRAELVQQINKDAGDGDTKEKA